MKTAYQVRSDYRQANSKADRIDKIADDIDLKRGRLADARGRLSQYWKGDNAKRYMDKLADREEELYDIAANLRHIARTIREIAQNSFDADMKSIELIGVADVF